MTANVITRANDRASASRRYRQSGLPECRVGEIVDFCRSSTVDIAVLTVTTTATADLARSVGRHLEELGIPAIVGGPGRTLSELRVLAKQRRHSPANPGGAP